MDDLDFIVLKHFVHRKNIELEWNYDMLWYDMIWYDMIWYDMIWYDMIWYDSCGQEVKSFSGKIDWSSCSLTGGSRWGSGDLLV